LDLGFDGLGQFSERPASAEDHVSTLQIGLHLVEAEALDCGFEFAHLDPVVRTQIDGTQQGDIDRHA
jgi:hypothetical protein